MVMELIRTNGIPGGTVGVGVSASVAVTSGVALSAAVAVLSTATVAVIVSVLSSATATGDSVAVPAAAPSRRFTRYNPPKIRQARPTNIPAITGRDSGNFLGCTS